MGVTAYGSRVVRPDGAPWNESQGVATGYEGLMGEAEPKLGYRSRVFRLGGGP